MVNVSQAAAWAPEAASNLMRLLPRDFQDAFVQSPNVFMLFMSMGIAAVAISVFWVLNGMMRASGAARVALRAQALRRNKDHRALVLIGEITGAGHNLRQEMKEAIEDNFGLFSFEQDVQVDLFPVTLKVIPQNAHPESRRRVAVEAADALERSAGEVIIWGKRNFLGKIDLRIMTLPGYGRTHEVQDLQLNWRVGRPDELVQRALAFALARKARPVLNRPQDYKPERLQPIVESLDKMVDASPNDVSEGLQLDLLSDFASGALSLGERGGDVKWLRKALDARQRYIDRVDRSTDPGAWGSAQQEIGRALTALGEREGARDKLEEGVSRLRIAMDALRSTDSLQQAEVALRALQRAENTLQQRRKIGLRWPV
jgi:tetratricopeptide (TPR) repeat protein